jgi:hypothetical protein
VASGSEGVEVGDGGWQWGERGGAGKGAVGPVFVVVPLIFGKDSAYVGEVSNQGAVEQFPAAGADPPSMIAFVRGIRIPILTTRRSVEANAAS